MAHLVFHNVNYHNRRGAELEYRSFEDLSILILKNIDKIPSDIDMIVGVPRSGLLVANMISLLINKSLTDIDGLFENRIISTGKTKEHMGFVGSIDACKKILVVEDSVASGESITRCKKKLSELNDSFEIVYLAVYVVADKKDLVDIFFEVLDSPRVFEWNIFHHASFISRSCFDIDGVLCVDPTQSENDDGENYIHFLQNAKEKIIPTCRIGYIVTSRLEKYRVETERWLNEHNVLYDELIMLDASAEERREQNLHAKFKAQIYKSKNALLFFESEEKQAIEISSITGKPVYCIENNKYYKGDKKYLFQYESTSIVRNYLKRFKLVRKIYYGLNSKYKC